MCVTEQMISGKHRIMHILHLHNETTPHEDHYRIELFRTR